MTPNKIELYFCMHPLNSETLLSEYLLISLPKESILIGDNTALLKIRKIKASYNYSIKGRNTKSGEAYLDQIFNHFNISDNFLRKNRIVSNLIPQFLVGDNSKIYSAIIFEDSNIMFLNSGSIEKLKEDSENEILSSALAMYYENIKPLANQYVYFNKYEADFEIEYKLNLPSKTDIWSLSQIFYDKIKNHRLEGYICQFQDEFNRWNFNNHLFEVTQPKESVGYVSFIESLNNEFVFKQKIFSKDALKRTELRTRGIKLESTMENYIKVNYPNLTFRKLQQFNRKRFDINLESLDTGNIFSIMFDYSTLINSPDKILVQCEIEYIKSRTVKNPTKVLEELEDVFKYVKNELDLLRIPYEETFYSKLSFLKEMEEKR